MSRRTTSGDPERRDTGAAPHPLPTPTASDTSDLKARRAPQEAAFGRGRHARPLTTRSEVRTERRRRLRDRIAALSLWKKITAAVLTAVATVLTVGFGIHGCSTDRDSLDLQEQQAAAQRPRLTVVALPAGAIQTMVTASDALILDRISTGATGYVVTNSGGSTVTIVTARELDANGDPISGTLCNAGQSVEPGVPRVLVFNREPLRTSMTDAPPDPFDAHNLDVTLAPALGTTSSGLERKELPITASTTDNDRDINSAYAQQVQQIIEGCSISAPVCPYVPLDNPGWEANAGQ